MHTEFIGLGPVFTPQPQMIGSDPERLARRYYSLFNERRVDDAERLVSPQAVFRYPHSREHLIGRKGYRELVRLWYLAFPDAVAEISKVSSPDPSTVNVDIIGRGTHLGPLSFGGLLNLPPTGKAAEMLLRDSLRFAEGLIVESTFQFDIEEMLRRLGADSRPER